MTRYPTLGDFIMGLEGLAILRAWAIDPATVKERTESIAEGVARQAETPWAELLVERERTVGDGYGEWALGYDRPDNPVLLAEEPVVHELLDARPVGAALDAACGTGRYASELVYLGHSVTGIDATPEMLDEARKKVPGARFELADLTALPLRAGSFDLAVCTLALTHCSELKSPIAELARVVRPGGRIILSDVHPVMTMLGFHARYPSGEGEFGFVRNHIHPFSDYLTAFREARLAVVQCREPVWGEAELATLGFAEDRPGLVEAAVQGLPIVVVWELEKGA